MGKILAARVPLSSRALNDLLEEDDGAVHANTELVTPFLGSVLIGTREQDVPLRTLHLSFRDFLVDPKRAGAFSINAKEHDDELATVTLNIANKYLTRDISGIRDPFVSNTELEDRDCRVNKWEALKYACRFWVE